MEIISLKWTPVNSAPHMHLIIILLWFLQNLDGAACQITIYLNHERESVNLNLITISANVNTRIIISILKYNYKRINYAYSKKEYKQ